MKRQVIFNVQLLRFLAAGAILFTHSYGEIAPDSWIITSVPWTGGVDVFFVVSGFIMTWMTQGQFGDRDAAGQFLRRRMIRIVPPYWFFTLVLVAVVAAAGGRIRTTTIDLAQLITSFLFVPWPRIDGNLSPILGQGWTLNYEMFFYLAFAAAMLFRRGLILLVGLFCLLTALHPLVPTEWFVPIFYSGPMILEFLAGIALARIYMTGWRSPLAGSTAMLGAAILWFVSIPAGESDFNEPIRVGIPAALIAAALILRPEPKSIGPIRRAFQAGGDASYTLYLSHTLVVNAVLMAAAMSGISAPWAVTAVAMAAAIAFSLLFYRIVEAPVTALLGRRLHAKVSAGPATVAP